MSSGLVGFYKTIPSAKIVIARSPLFSGRRGNPMWYKYKIASLHCVALAMTNYFYHSWFCAPFATKRS